LIVSDDAAIAAALTVVLRGAGHTVTNIVSPALALQACTSQSFQLAIVDESVCEMAGPELARALHDFFSVPTLFLSAYNEPEIVRAALAEGSLGLIIKPLEPTSLLPALQISLSRAREMQARTPRNGLRRYVYAYWQQLLAMGHKLVDSANNSREIDAAILLSRNVRKAAPRQRDEETKIDSDNKAVCATRRHSVKH
jgi:DNA-binding response OmpR family regulator